MHDVALIAVQIGWHNHETLMKIVDGTGILIAQVLVHQIGGTLHALPVYLVVIQEIERGDCRSIQRHGRRYRVH